LPELPHPIALSGPPDALLPRFLAVRARTERLCLPLTIEDHIPQPVTEVSPPRWHLGHTAWFFESFVLQPNLAGYRVFHPRFNYLFNSYYETLGDRLARDQRGTLGRPTVADVIAYRAHVDGHMRELLSQPSANELASLIELGLQHEQQHQELLVTDLKYILGTNPLAPVYDEQALGGLPVDDEMAPAAGSPLHWVEHPGGLVRIGHAGADPGPGSGAAVRPAFAFDNEASQHQVMVPRVQIRAALVTQAEYLAFMQDGGYDRFDLWHAEAWDWLRQLPVHAPLYWQPAADEQSGWLQYTLNGVRPLQLQAPVTHLSYYEAYAFCQWKGWRLPTEFEWEAVAPSLDWGQRWEWTESAYLPYPGFRRSAGAVGEYNGKFMVNQKVLRGASFATPPGHERLTYRNFFHPHLRWQYTGIRPARDWT